MNNWNQFGEFYNQPVYIRKVNKYLIASTPRTGSHYLAYLLFNSGGLGSPLEYLNPMRQPNWRELLGTANWADTFNAQIELRTSPSGWFGLKSHWRQFSNVIHEPNMIDCLNFDFYIRIKRDDIIAQAVSLAISHKNYAWLSYFEPGGIPEYDFFKINEAHKRIFNENFKWDEYFKSKEIYPLIVLYDELIASPVDIVNSIRGHMKLEPIDFLDSKSGPQQQSTEINKY